MSDNITENKQVVRKRSLTVQERKVIDRLNQKGLKHQQSLFRASETNCKGNLEVVLDEGLESHEAVDLIDSRIMEATGTANPNLGISMLSKVAQAILPSKADAKTVADQFNMSAQSMQALAPQDEYEGQLIAQLVVLHEHAMDWLGRASRTDRVDFANVYLNGASKLLARHHETLDTLLKYRRRGVQQVHVEHVHIHSGAQAVVGNITTGGGLNPQNAEGPHAKV